MALQHYFGNGKKITKKAWGERESLQTEESDSDTLKMHYVLLGGTFERQKGYKKKNVRNNSQYIFKTE